MFFNVSGYIYNIINDNIFLKIIDEENLIKFQQNINKLYKTESDIDLQKNIYKFKINKNTKFIIKNYIYTNLKELIGIYITISGQFKYYCFKYDTTIINEINNELESEKKIRKGYLNICNKIYN